METRKFKKHMVEKRRRTRINHSLLELKELVLEAFCKDASKYDKMEKADILDLTVKYLERIQTEKITTHRIRACQAAAALSICASSPSRVPPMHSNYPIAMPSTSSVHPNPPYPSYMNCKSQQSRGIDMNNNVLSARSVLATNSRTEDPFNIAHAAITDNSKLYYDKSSSLDRHSTHSMSHVYDLRSKERQTAVVKPFPRHALPKRNATITKLVEPVPVNPSSSSYPFSSSTHSSHKNDNEYMSLKSSSYPLSMNRLDNSEKISFMGATIQGSSSRCHSWRPSMVV